MTRGLTAALGVLSVLGVLMASGCGAPSAAHPAPAGVTGIRPGRSGCIAPAASAPRLRVAHALVRVGGYPFGVAVTRDGRWAFVSMDGPMVQVFRAGSGLTLTRAGAVTVPGAQLAGETLTSGGRYLLAASDRGAVVIDVAAAERGGPHAVLGTLAAPGGGGAPQGAIEVAVSHNSQLAFVSLEYSRGIAVFRLDRALTSGFGPADYLGSIPTGYEPVGLALSPDGRWLYATSERALRAPVGPHADGTLSVISVRRAVTDPAHAVVATVAAGCQPVRVITSPGGAVAWVTARGSNELLGFSTALLRRHPARSLIARVRVGVAPVGLALVNDGRQIVVADSNRFLAAGASASLAVVQVAGALAGHPALAGLLPAGQFPREMAVTPSGRTLLVTCFDSGQVELVDLTRLP